MKVTVCDRCGQENVAGSNYREDARIDQYSIHRKGQVSISEKDLCRSCLRSVVKVFNERVDKRL